MQRKHPELYRMLSRVFNQDLGARVAALARERRCRNPQPRQVPCRHLPEQQSPSSLQAAPLGWHSGTLQTGACAQSVSRQSIAPSQSLSTRSAQ